MQNTGTELFEQYHLAAFRYFLRATGSRDVAQDLTQDLFLKVVRNLRSQKREPEPAWIFHIARNLLFDYRRTHRTVLVPLSDARSSTVHPAQLVAFSVSEALALVSEGERDAFLLREVVGLSYAEIAEVCEIKTEAVRSRLYEARRRLKALLGARLSADENKRRNHDG
jgi:RNA polymerase sigma-70 factor (ECF subfamily)